jgi:hypothetical protein
MAGEGTASFVIEVMPVALAGIPMDGDESASM